MRFRSLVWWPYLLLFLAIIGPCYLWIEIHFDGPFHRIVADEWIKHLVGRYPNGNWSDDVPRLQFLTSHLAWWVPWSLAILPAPMFSWRRVMRPREISFQDALPMAWAIVVLAPVLAIGQRQDYYALSMFSAFALWAAMIFERAPNSLRNLGAAAVGLVGIAIGLIAIALPRFLPKNESEWAKQILGGRRGRHWPICRQAPGCIFAHFSPSPQSGSLPAQSSRFIYFAADAKKSQRLA